MKTVKASEVEIFINEYLKEDIRRLEQYVDAYNQEIMEFVQLKNSINLLWKNHKAGFKTQLNIGGNILMQAEVESLDKVLIDIGKSCYVEFSVDEAIKYIHFKIALLTKECQAVRDESVKKRADVKLALTYMADKK